MERMRIVTDNTKVNENLLKRVKELEEENKRLEEEISSLRIEIIQEKWKTGKKWTPSTPYI